MNERIRELAEQAGLSHMPSDYPDMADLYQGADFELEKFAELIVKECILTIQMDITRDGHNTEKYLRSMKHIKQIKEHFGVE
jgi:hypothetical protein